MGYLPASCSYWYWEAKYLLSDNFSSGLLQCIGFSSYCLPLWKLLGACTFDLDAGGRVSVWVMEPFWRHLVYYTKILSHHKVEHDTYIVPCNDPSLFIDKYKLLWWDSTELRSRFEPTSQISTPIAKSMCSRSSCLSFFQNSLLFHISVATYTLSPCQECQFTCFFA